jgi:hypothetical protein
MLREFSNIPVIMLTAKGEKRQGCGLELGPMIMFLSHRRAKSSRIKAACAAEMP